MLGVLALVMRLAWPTPPTLASVDAGGLAAFGEHALCLAAPSGADPAPASRGQLPPPTGDHADHDHSLCCLWHASAGFALPQIEVAARVAFIEAALPVAAAADFHPASLTGATRARGPPTEA